MKAAHNHRVRRIPFDQYAVTIALVLCAVALRVLLHPILGAKSPYTTFYPAVLLAAYIYGRNAGLLATVCSAFIAHWMFADPGFHSLLSTSNLLGLVLFTTNCAIAVLIISDLLNLSSRISDELHRTEKVYLESAVRLNRVSRCGAP